MTETTYTVADYKNLVAQMRRDMAAQFPELANDIYIIDQSNNAETELANAAAVLSLPDLAARVRDFDFVGGGSPRANGQVAAFEIDTESGPRTVQLAYGWGYDAGLENADPSQTIKASVFRELSKVTFHESFHALYEAAGMGHGENVHYEEESLAETFAMIMALRTGIMDRADIDGLNAQYDVRRMFDGDGNIAINLSDEYDPSAEFASLIATHPGSLSPNTQRSESLPLRETFEQVRSVAESTALTDQQKFTAGLLQSAGLDAIAQLREQGKSEDEIMAFAQARPWLFPDLQRAVAARDYLAEVDAMVADYDAREVPREQREYPIYTPIIPVPTDLSQAAANARLQQAQSNDPLDRAIAEMLVNELPRESEPLLNPALPAGGLTPQQEAAIVNDPNDTGLASLLKGVQLGTVFGQMSCDAIKLNLNDVSTPSCPIVPTMESTLQR